MAQAYLANKYNEIIEKPNLMIEMDTFKSNINTRSTRPNEAEVPLRIQTMVRNPTESSVWGIILEAGAKVHLLRTICYCPPMR